MNVQHSSRTDKRYTPAWIMDQVRCVLGRVDFDPASDERGNINVQASAFLTTGGLEREWGSGAIFLNPPGGKVGNRSQAGLFWSRLMDHRLTHPGFTHAIFMAFSAEMLQSTQGQASIPIAHFPLCIPKKRIRFEAAGPTLKQSPSHSNVIVYIPGSVNKTALFKSVFQETGVILNV